MLKDRMLDEAEERARRVGASALRGIGAAVLALLACMFLTAGAWLYLSNRFDPVVASLGLGLFFALAAVLLMVIRPRRPQPKRKPEVGLDDLVEVFVASAQLGRSARK